MNEVTLVFEDEHGFNVPSIIETMTPLKGWVVHDVLRYGDNNNMVVFSRSSGCGECTGYGCRHCRTYKEFKIDDKYVKSPIFKYGFVRN